MKDRPSLAVFLIALCLISFSAHLVWEWAQCEPFFIHGAAPATVTSMLVATLGDVALTLLAYGGVAAINSNRWPLNDWPVRVWITLLSLALLLSLAVELYALGSDRWSYTDAAPRVPGTPISILPVAQLLILFPISFRLARVLALKIGARQSGVP